MATKNLSLLCVVAVLLLSAVSAQAAPITLTSDSYNQDSILALAGDTFQGCGLFGDWTLYEAGGGRPGNGMPTGGLVTGTGGVSFQLASYLANNMLLLQQNSNSGTMTLDTPGQFSQLSFLGIANVGDDVTATLNFTTGAPTVLSSFYINTFAGDNGGAVLNAGIAQDGFGTVLGGTWGAFYQSPAYTLSAGDQARTLESVTFSYPNSDHRVGIFAISGDGIAVPEPGTTALVLSGIAGLLAYAWRKRR